VPGNCDSFELDKHGQGFAIDDMRLSVVFTAALVASADAAAFEKRQRGNPDGTCVDVTFSAGEN
jgi:hypothetical protein